MIEQHELPSNWQWSTMSASCEKIQDGTHFSPDQDKQLPAGKYPYVTAKNVRPSGLDLMNLTYLAENEHRKIYERCDPQTGDVLLVKDGVNMGDAAINTIEGEISLLSSVCMLRPRNHVLTSAFLRYYILSPQGFRSLTGQMTGTAIKRVILRKIRETPVPIAPLNEQRRIAAEIDELFSDLDAGEAALKRAKANLKRYRAAVLKAAVEGKLTEEWRAVRSPAFRRSCERGEEADRLKAGLRTELPTVEPASKLLARILKERRQKWEADQLAKFAAAGKEPPKNWKEKYVEPTPPDTAGLAELPEGWCWVAFGQVAQFQNGRAFPSNEYASEGVRLLRPGNLFADGKVRWTEKNSRFMLPEWAETYPTYIIRGNELVMNLTAQSLADEFLGRMCLTSPDECCLLNQRLARITPLDGLDKQFTLYLLKSAVFRKFVNGLNTGSLIEHMFTSQLETCCLPLAPLAEQDQIVAEVAERLSQIAAAETIIDHCLLRADRLRQSILKQAFEGKLVPQDPTDEPANVLLERLRASRSAHEGNGKRPGSALPHRSKSRGNKS